MMATYFLMQESKNIFELPPQERLSIFKNIFDLLGIDQNKEKIAEYKRETNALIKARSDVEQYDTKLQRNLQTLITQRPTLQTIWKRYDQHLDAQWLQFIQEQQLLGDKVIIEHFHLPTILATEEIKNCIADRQDHYHTQKTQTDLAQQALRTHENHITTIQQQYETIAKDISHIESQSQQRNEQVLLTLQDEIQHIQQQQTQLRTTQEAQ